MRKYLLIALSLLLTTPAMADWTGKDASGATITFKNANTCSSVVCVPVAEPVDSTGAAFGVSGNPFFISVASLPLPSGAATAANQSTEITSLATIATNTGAAIPAGTATIGNTGTDPSSGKATPTFAFLALPQTTTTQMIALSGTKVTYVTSLHFMASGAVNVTLKYGTGTNCGTGTTTLDGPFPLAAQAGMAIGSGTGAILIVPAGQELCVTTDANMSGTVGATYQQF